MEKNILLSDELKPLSYELQPKNGILKIQVRKMGRPSKRLTLHQQNLKVTAAKIIYSNKNKFIEHEVIRINHLPTLNQVRLHTSHLLYPGEYELQLTFSSTEKLDWASLADKDLSDLELRKFFPCIDEPAARASVKLEIS